jgi:hypothetical protein
MGMRGDVLRVLRSATEPLLAEQVCDRLHGITIWKRTSITGELGRLVAAGLVKNLARDPQYGNLEHRPSTYVIVDNPRPKATGERSLVITKIGDLQ